MTKRVRFLPLRADDLEALETRADVRLGEVSELLRDVVRQMAEHLAAVPRDAVWGAYWAVDVETAQVVGTCAFKGAPNADGAVEIAYFTFPPFEGQGYGTAMAGKLVKLARSSELVRLVVAHTLPERNASGRLLEKNGFRYVGEVVDPEDGLVWRWELELADARGTSISPNPASDTDVSW